MLAPNGRHLSTKNLNLLSLGSLALKTSQQKQRNFSGSTQNALVRSVLPRNRTGGSSSSVSVLVFVVRFTFSALTCFNMFKHYVTAQSKSLYFTMHRCFGIQLFSDFSHSRGSAPFFLLKLCDRWNIIRVLPPAFGTNPTGD